MKINDPPHTGISTMNWCKTNYYVEKILPGILVVPIPFMIYDAIVNRTSEMEAEIRDKREERKLKRSITQLKLDKDSCAALQDNHRFEVLVTQMRETVRILGSCKNFESKKYKQMYKHLQLNYIGELWKNISDIMRRNFPKYTNSEKSSRVGKYFAESYFPGLEYQALLWMKEAEIIDTISALKIEELQQNNICYSKYSAVPE